VRIVRHLGLFTAAALSGAVFSFAGEVLVTPDDASLEKWAAAAFYQSAEIEPEVRVNGSSSVQIPVSGGGTATVFSQANADVSLEQNLELAGVVLVVRPKKLRYSVSLAQIRNFEIEFASGSLTNSLRSDNGFRVGLGIAGSFVPVTTASVGIGWSLDYRHLVTGLRRFESGGVVSAANQRFTQDEFQAAVTACWRWKMIAPYAAIKLQRWVTRLADRGTRESIRGESEGLSPAIGIEWTPLPGEGLVIEASFVDEESLTASWIAKF